RPEPGLVLLHRAEGPRAVRDLARAQARRPRAAAARFGAPRTAVRVAARDTALRGAARRTRRSARLRLRRIASPRLRRRVQAAADPRGGAPAAFPADDAQESRRRV